MRTHLAMLHTGSSVKAKVAICMVVEESLQHIQHFGHLGEDEDSMTLTLQLPQECVQNLQFTCTENA